MTLPASGFSLTDVNTEIGVTGQSLSQCIGLAGKTGIWNKLSDFAGYSHTSGGITLSVTAMGFLLDGSPVASGSTTVTAADYSWYVLSKPTWITATPSSGATGPTSVAITCDANVGAPRSGTVVFYQYTTGYTVNLDVSQEGI